jgi:hypothetical protein
MHYLIGILVLAMLLGVSAAVVLIALARLVEILPPPGARGEEEEATAGKLPARPPGRRLLH